MDDLTGDDGEQTGDAPVLNAPELRHDAARFPVENGSDQSGRERLQAKFSALVPGLMMLHRMGGDRDASGKPADMVVKADDAARFTDALIAAATGQVSLSGADSARAGSRNGPENGPRAVIKTVRARGVSEREISIKLFAHAARVLGEHWENDTLSLVDVTIASCKLHTLLHEQTLALANGTLANGTTATGAIVQTTGTQSAGTQTKGTQTTGTQKAGAHADQPGTDMRAGAPAATARNAPHRDMSREEFYQHSPRVLIGNLMEDQHTFGAAMVEQAFLEAGWRTVNAVGADMDFLCLQLRREHFDILALSVSNDFDPSDGADDLATLRSASCNPSLRVFVGGRAFSENPSLVGRIGADGWARDAFAAPGLAENLLEGRGRRC